MPASEKELEEQLTEVGARLSSFPSSIDQLLPLLDRLEICLSRVTQDPSESLQKALAPSLKALVEDVLLRHSSADVRVAVAACVNEIIRITAPEAPYPDDQMKDIFELIISSFEKLYDKSNASYNKTVIILETFSRVRSFVLMLDLECNDLMLEMFNSFFKTIRDDHPKGVFASMEAIMTLVFEESEEILQELVASILSCLERDNKEVLPVAQELGKKVLENCASKLKPFLVDIIKSLGKSLDNYINVVADLCQGTPGELNSMDVGEKNLAAENVQSKTTDIADEVPVEKPLQTVPSVEVPAAAVSSPKPITSNGSRENEVDESSGARGSFHLTKSVVHNDPQTTTEMAQIQDVIEEKTSSMTKSESQSEPDNTNKKKGRKRNYLEITTEISQPQADSDKVQEALDHNGGKSKNTSSSAQNPSAADTAIPSENEECNAPSAASEVSRIVALSGNAPSPSQTVPNESQSEKGGQGRKKFKLTLALSGYTGSSKILEDVVSKSKTTAIPSENEESNAPTAAPKVSGNEALGGNAPSQGQTVPNESKSKKRGQGRKKVKLTPASSGDTGSTKILEDLVSEFITDKQNDHKGQAAEETSCDLPQGSNREVGKLSKFDAESVEQAVKINEDVVGPSGDMKKKTEKGKSPSREVILGTPAEDIYKRPVCSPKSLSKPNNQDELEKERSAKLNSKRKRTPAKPKAAQVSTLVGSRIKVWWPEDETYYEGVVAEYIPEKHKVTYDDGEEEVLVLKDEKWELVDDKFESHKGHVGKGEMLETSSEMHKNRKAKLNPESSTKQAKKPRIGATPSSKGEANASSRGEATPSSPVHKPKDEGALDTKSKVASLEDKKGMKSKDQKGGKSVDGASKSVGNSEDDNMDMLLSSMKPKKGTPKNAGKSKAKSTKSEGKSGSSSSGKGADVKKSAGSIKTPESGKAEPKISSKGKKSNTKSGKK